MLRQCWLVLWDGMSLSVLGVMVAILTMIADSFSSLIFDGFVRFLFCLLLYVSLFHSTYDISSYCMSICPCDIR